MSFLSRKMPWTESTCGWRPTSRETCAIWGRRAAKSDLQWVCTRLPCGLAFVGGALWVIESEGSWGHLAWISKERFERAVPMRQSTDFIKLARLSRGCLNGFRCFPWFCRWNREVMCYFVMIPRVGICSCLGVGCLVGRGLCVEEGSLWEGALLLGERVWWRALLLGKAGDECKPWSGGGCRLTNN